MRESNYTPLTKESGFSLIELMIAMLVTLIIMGLASALLARSFNVRAREDRRAEAIADVQRALNIMTREIANAGYRLPANRTFTSGGVTHPVPQNGIVAANSSDHSIRIISNLNALSGGAGADTVETETVDANEDVQFLWHRDTKGTAVTSDDSFYLLRHDNNVPTTSSTSHPTTVLANRIDMVNIYYFDQKVDYTTNMAAGNYSIAASGVTELSASVPAQAARVKFIVISVGVRLPPVGTPGTEGYQPESRVQVVSDVLLRNAETREY